MPMEDENVILFNCSRRKEDTVSGPFRSTSPLLSLLGVCERVGTL
jgi:hypothetical protein